MYYLIKQTLCTADFERLKTDGAQYVAVLTSAEWAAQKNSFDMGIEIEPLTNEIHSTKAEVNYDSLTGTFSIPHRNDFETVSRFAFALDEKGKLPKELKRGVLSEDAIYDLLERNKELMATVCNYKD